jgi:hypothetical protein
VAVWAVVLSLLIQTCRPDILSAETSGEHDGSGERRKRRQERRRRMIENILKGRWHGAVLQDPVAVVVPLDLAEEFIQPFEPPAVPERLRGVEFPMTYPILAEEARAWSSPDPFVESLLAMPDHLVGAVATALNQIRPGDGGIVDRLLNVGVQDPGQSLLSSYAQMLFEREQRYFTRFEETTAADTLDEDDLLDDQKKLVWETLKRTYQARYRLKNYETVSDDAFSFSGWRGVDLVVVPPLMAGYLMYHGIDKKFSVFGTKLRLSVEPYSDWKDDDLPAGAGLEWSPDGWPVALIVTAGMEDGRFKGDFVGIGTSIGMVRRMLALEEGEGLRER